MIYLIRAVIVLATAALVASCGPGREVILPGERLDLRPSLAVDADGPRPIRLAAQVNHASWTHRAGGPLHRIQHAAFTTTPTLVWSAAIGQGNDRKHRIAADPVAANGIVYTMDSRSRVTATGSNGAAVWTRDLTPGRDGADDASGGGLTLANSQLLVTTGFGDLVSLNPANGAQNWEQVLGAPATGAVTVANGLIYVATRDSGGWALDPADGRIRWHLEGTPSVTGVVGGAAPAADSGLVVFPFSSSQVVGAFPKGGFQLWNGSVAGGHLGEAYAQVTDVSGDPVIAGGAIYVGNPTGRTVALDRKDGEPIWTAGHGATGPVLVEGGSVFLVSDRAELVRLDARDGRQIWSSDLPGLVPQRRARRLRDVYPNFGPVLAGGLLWVASGDGNLRGFNPVDGDLQAAVPLPGGAATRPIVVSGAMYIVSADGQLLAFR